MAHLNPGNGMSQYDFLIHLRRFSDDVAATEIGLRLAARLQAHALGLHTVAISPASFASPEAVAMYANEARQLCEEALAHAPWWQQRLASHKLQGQLQVVQGDPVEALCHGARWCHFVVMERPTVRRDAPTGWGLTSRTVFGSPAPVIVVPEIARVGPVGEHVMIAWNGSREATLAVRFAQPLLERATRVTVLEGDGGSEPSAFGIHYLPSVSLQRWLERRGIHAQFVPFEPDGDEGPALLAAVHEHGGDLLVTGAWGHSRITEMVLGGVTRHLFQNSEIPLLVAH